MPRSVDFGTYHELLKLNVPSARDVRLLLSLLQVRVLRMCVCARACVFLVSIDRANRVTNEQRSALSGKKSHTHTNASICVSCVYVCFFSYLTSTALTG